jgi:hypothetical protein
MNSGHPEGPELARNYVVSPELRPRNYAGKIINVPAYMLEALDRII